MILTVSLLNETDVTNVRYKWFILGVEGLEQSSGITQPDADFSLFRIDAAPPEGAEEMLVYDVSNPNNWNNVIPL